MSSVSLLSPKGEEVIEPREHWTRYRKQPAPQSKWGCYLRTQACEVDSEATCIDRPSRGCFAALHVLIASCASSQQGPSIADDDRDECPIGVGDSPSPVVQVEGAVSSGVGVGPIPINSWGGPQVTRPPGWAHRGTRQPRGKARWFSRASTPACH